METTPEATPDLTLSATPPPMVEVVDLVREYADGTGVHGASFAIPKGAVAGLLGPNGAGKSTLIRILSTFLAADSGTARVAGRDVFREAHEVRARVGYLPELNPMHPDMRVGEYLRFRGELKGMANSRLSSRLDTVLEQFSLGGVRRKLIQNLSKGFRQRVGMADAMLHEPELLILDEPTVGLDPEQMLDVRQLIRSLAGTQTVLLSTHVLHEVELTCSWVVVINQGRVLASDSIESLCGANIAEPAVFAEVAAEEDEIRSALQGLVGFEGVEFLGRTGAYARCRVVAAPGVDIRPAIHDLARLRDWGMRELSRGRRTLEEAYLQLVTKPAKTEAA